MTNQKGLALIVEWVICPLFDVRSPRPNTKFVILLVIAPDGDVEAHAGRDVELFLLDVELFSPDIIIVAPSLSSFVYSRWRNSAVSLKGLEFKVQTNTSSSVLRSPFINGSHFHAFCIKYKMTSTALYSCMLEDRTAGRVGSAFWVSCLYYR